MRPLEGLAAAPALPEVGDDFYELNEDDLAVALSLGRGSGSGAGAEPQLQTAAMRELSKLKKLKEYSHALIRGRLPGGLLVQAAFHP